MRAKLSNGKNVTTTVIVLAEIAHRKVIVVLNLQMEGAVIMIQIFKNLDAAMKACFGINVRQNFQKFAMEGVKEDSIANQPL